MASPNSPQPGGKPAVIRGLSSRDGLGGSWLRWIPAWIISGVGHGIILGVALLMAVLIGRANPPVVVDPSVAETDVEDPGQKADLTNPDIGLNPDVPLNYNVDRIEPVSV